MGVGSIILGIAAFLFMFLGFFLSIVPVLGTLLSFGAPLLAIAGIVMGGLAMSRAKREGESGSTGLAGVIVNVVALVPAVVVAMTCGLCNACVTAGMLDPDTRRAFRLDGGTGFGPGTGGGFGFFDAGSGAPGTGTGTGLAPDKPDLGQPTGGTGTPPADTPPTGTGTGTPPPAFPPPPI